MNLSKTKIALFFVAIVVLGWLLYPRQIFIAYMYEGVEDFSKAEKQYTDYLEKHPFDKFATLRLAQLYDRMAVPEKATPLLKGLYEHRKKDWETAQRYLTHLEDMNDFENLFEARREVALNFITVPHFPPERIYFLLESSLHYALWQQKYDEAYDLLDDLIAIAENPDYYYEVREKIDRGLKRMDKVLASLKQRIVKKPGDVLLHRDAVNVLIALKRLDEAKAFADKALKAFPNDLYLLQSRAFIANRLGLKTEAIRDIESILRHPALEPADRLLFRTDLGFLFLENGKPQLALEIFRQTLKERPEDRSAWLNILSVYLNTRQVDTAIRFLGDYLNRFSDDWVRWKLLADMNLYDKKNTQALGLYTDYVRHARDAAFALDVGYLLLQRRLTQAAEDWFLKGLSLFPGNSDILKNLFSIYLDRKAYAQAIPLGEDYLSANPRDADMTLTVAQMYTATGDREAAVGLYDRLLEIRPDTETRKMVGRELLFMGYPDKAELELERVAAASPQDGEAWFWLSETRQNQGDRDGMLDASRNAVATLEAKPGTSPEQYRMLLKSRGRLGYSPELVRDYRTALERDRRDVDLHADFVDMQLEYARLWEAEQEVQHFKDSFPAEEARIRPAEVRLAFRRHEWERAIELLGRLLRENPGHPFYRRDLAEAHVQNGAWKTGIRQYEELETEGEGDVTARLDELHDEFDHEVRAAYRFVSQETEDFMEWGAGFTTYLSEDWSLKGDYFLGDFEAPAVNYREVAGYGETDVSFHGVRDWVFTLGAGFGASTERTTVSPAAGIRYSPFEDLNMDLTAGLRRLRTDLPQAVAAGDVQDYVTWRGEYRLLKRILLGGRYEFTRDYLPGGEESFGHLVEPSLSFVLLEDPYVTLGYLFSFADQSDGGGFLNLVPLISRTEAHFVRAYAAKKVGRRLVIEVNAFAGEDPARDLHLFEGDLFGAGAKLRWRAHKNMNLDVFYEFGRETNTNIPGESHQAGVLLTGHWF